MFSEYLGIESDYVIIGVAAVSLLLFIILFVMLIVTMVKLHRLKKKYNDFMSGTNAKSLEDTLLARLNQVDDLIAANTTNEKNIEELFNKMKVAFSKVGLVKYDAFNEMGGKLSFSLALLNESNDGFVMNAVHSREGCYTYMKEIVGGNSIIVLSEEEQEALKMAKEAK